MERFEGDNNSWVKIQLFAWGLTLWGLSGRSVGGEGFLASETEATYKALVKTSDRKNLGAETDGAADLLDAVQLKNIDTIANIFLFFVVEFKGF